jgi:hypothetical protein
MNNQMDPDEYNGSRVSSPHLFCGQFSSFSSLISVHPRSSVVNNSWSSLRSAHLFPETAKAFLTTDLSRVERRRDDE